MKALIILGVLAIVCSGVVIGLLVASSSLEKEVEDTHRELYGDPDDWGVQ